MNWPEFFKFFAVTLALPIVLFALVAICMWLDKRIGTYATVGCLFVFAALVGATAVGLLVPLGR